MSHAGGVEAVRPSSPSSSHKRKRDGFEQSHSLVTTGEASAASRSGLANNTSSSSHDPRALKPSTSHGDKSNNLTSPDSDDMHHSDPGDTLQGVGSASSLASAASSAVFSTTSQAFTHNSKASLANGLTPLTNHTDSSPPKISSPSHSTKIAADTVGGASPPAFNPARVMNTPPPQMRPEVRPPQGVAKGYRAVYDPDLDSRLSKEDRKRAKFKSKDFGTEAIEADPPPDPRLAIPGYRSGNCRSIAPQKKFASQATLRLAPYVVKPYGFDPKSSVGPGPPKQVVVVGYDPLLCTEAVLKSNFGHFGEIAVIERKLDPNTGSYLAIALIRYRDKPAVHGSVAVKAADAAKRAEAEGNGTRIGLHHVKVERDREGRRCKRHMERALERQAEERKKDRVVSSAPVRPSETPQTPAIDSPAPPLNAPKGPSGAPKGPSGRPAIKPPAGPRIAEAPPPPPRNAAAASLIEDKSILSQIKRKPYLFISNKIVPVLGTTIPHLKKRLKAYDWREVRLDKTGYYIVFEDSKRGEDETVRTFNECNRAALFTYQMEMECQQYGNPDYERSPSPERAETMKRKKDEFERLQREEIEDLEIEKKERARNLDPVQGALDQLRIELRDKIMSDIKTRIAIPMFHDSLDPARHSAKRRKLGLPDPSDNENKVHTLLYNKDKDTPPGTPRGRFGHSLSHSKPLRPHDPNSQRGRKPLASASTVFGDERRQRPVKRSQARPLHFRLQQMYDQDEDDSDDERHTSLTRDTEDQESRPLSRASRNSTPFETESVAEDTPRHKRLKARDWDDEEQETFDGFHKQLLGHLLHKQPENLATRELEQVVNTLPRSSKFATRARTELYIRQRSKFDDELFGVKNEDAKETAIDTTEDVEMRDQELENTPSVDVDVKAVKDQAKKKRKSKKEILEEQQALKVEAKKEAAAQKAVSKATVKQIKEKEVELEAVAELDSEESRGEVDFRLSSDKPRRTVEDDVAVVLDVDGWQHTIKDDEDLMFARRALAEEAAYEIGDPKLWAFRQKEIKALNNGGAHGPVHAETGIQGYYVSNPSGCARTEGVGKILNEEKSKYLPHRIKVQKAREERQAQAKADPTAAAEAAKNAAAAKIASTAASRGNRVNNRRLVNEINLQKQTIASAGIGSDADVAIRFNQLKKRKKLVKFDRSAIHGWGLYAEENIAMHDLIIEYVGEKVRQKVADLREIRYDKQGIGSSYLFRLVDDEIVDATKKGGIARFINHSCDPNCTAKIIRVEGTRRIVIYALKDIGKNEELTYDYKFEREFGATDRIPCLCGSANCKGFLN